MPPSAREVEEVILATLKRGDWARAATLLAGAVKLPCVPTSRTYMEVVAAVVTRSTWEDTVRVLDRLQTSPLSARALYHTAADALLLGLGSVAADSLLAIILAARRRRVPLAPRHHVQCSHLLLGVGDWCGAILAGSQERLVQHVPALAHPMMLAAAAGRQWIVGSKIMSSLLVTGSAPSGNVTESFIRCFTPTSPWWRALAVASVLSSSSSSSEPGVSQAARELRAEVERGVEFPGIDAEKKRFHTATHPVEGHVQSDDFTLEEATVVLATMKEQHWDKALNLLRSFPALLSIAPRSRALLSPMALHNTAARRYYYWEAVWQAVSHSLASAPIDEALTIACSFAEYVRAQTAAADNKGGDSSLQEKMEEVERAGHTMSTFISTRFREEKRSLEPVALHSFVQAACACGWWEDALSLTERPAVVFTALVQGCRWQAAMAVYGAMQPSAQERVAPQLEHLYISRGLWVPALQYAQQRLPGDTLALRNLAIPLCGALGQWSRALSLLRHVSNPTALENLLQRHCIMQHSEECVRSACRSGDWMKALQKWEVIRRLAHDQTTVSFGGKREIEEESQLRMSPHAVKSVAKLLLDHQRYDECCMVVSAHTPTASDPVLLRCLQLFYHIRQSPLLYGRVLQKYREAHTPYRIVLDCYAILALGVSENHVGAFSILQQLMSEQNADGDITIAQRLDEVPHVKTLLSTILCHITEPSRASDVEAVMASLTKCMRSLDDIDFLSKPLTAFWASENEALRGCAFRVSVGLLQHMTARELPVPWAVMRILAEGLQGSSSPSTVNHLYKALLHRSSFDASRLLVIGGGGGSGGSGEDVSGEKSEVLRTWQEDKCVLFRMCAQAFIHEGQWERALDAMQHCETADPEVLFRTAVLAKEEKERRKRMVHCVVAEAVANNEDGLHYVTSRRQVEGALLTLMQLQAWREALVLFNSSVAPYQRFDNTGRVPGPVFGALLSCVATSAPWETTLRLLTKVQQELPPGANSLDKGLTDVLRSLRCHGGPIICSRVLLFMVEEMGIAPTPEQYEVLLHSCLGSQLTTVERDACAVNLKRLSRSLNEKQVLDLVLAITKSRGSWEEHEDGVVDADDVRSSTNVGVQRRHSSHQCTSLTSWMPKERPPLSAEELRQLYHLAPLIILATPRRLEGLSRQAFMARFRPFELKLLLQHYRLEVLAHLDDCDDDGAFAFDAHLVEHCQNNQLLHVLLTAYEGAWLRLSRTAAGENKSEFLEQLRCEVFNGFASPRAVMAVWEACRSSVSQLAAQRWPWLCEYELLREVRRRGGRTPASLHTRPGMSKTTIASYWGTYGRVLWPEMFLSGPELCQLAVYVPLVEPLLGKEHEQQFRELLTGIQVAHFSPEAIPQQESLLRQPRSVDAIRAVFRLAFKTLKRLHAQLDMDARGGRYYYHHYPDASLWRRYAQQCDVLPAGRRLSRWSLALRILHHYRRCTTTALQPRTLAALFAACAADAADGICGSCEAHCGEGEISWWAMALQCAQNVEPALSRTLWRHAMQLACVSSSPLARGSTANAGEYRAEDMCDTSLQAIIRVVLYHVKGSDARRIPFRVSLLLVDRMKELLCVSPSFGAAQREDNNKGEDALIVWVLLQKHHCLEKMEPLHAALLKRLVLEGQSPTHVV
ncbi:putative NADH-dependent fumarate reductase [Trypanosoma grayi]|uniref:putative NADH-dependent fumarate reductase n=1 Tax=Trypanosoma grayi TaxID=71804 RepID=UPI0004F48495|nr:putative NADH-dependent fumarate reductase [Trypanosoma grayi]KEG13427.1 putative NADH-dependent fumarate reductase [Trypanosoma grayi]